MCMSSLYRSHANLCIIPFFFLSIYAAEALKFYYYEALLFKFSEI